ncbi:MAG: hypothetical protein AB8B84_11035 [Granulosicoccus sp.]
MYCSRIKGLIVIASCLALGACTETIIREVTPGNTTNSTTDTLGVGANMVAAGTSTTTTASPLENSNLQLRDPSDDTVVGSPGNTVDCNDSLPCRWVSADNQFSLTITSADNTATRSRLSLNYFVTTAHDSTIAVSRTSEAIDNMSNALHVEDQSLGQGNGGSPQGILAADKLVGTVNFDGSATGDSISQWSIALLDSGAIRIPAFSGIPVGPITTAQADCRYTLPCIWTAPDNDVAITLNSVGGISTNGRVSTDFSVETSALVTIAVDEGSYAIGADGTDFVGRTLSLGTMTDYKKVTRNSIPNTPNFGSIHFFRTSTTPTHLLLMELKIYQDDPVPRWNPQFINVPIL